MRESRQITVLRSLFATLHPKLKSGLQTGLAPARRLLTGSQSSANPETESAGSTQDSASGRANEAQPQSAGRAASRESTPSSTQPDSRPRVTSATPLPRTLTDEHLITELETITRQYELPDAPRKPQRGRRHYSRDTLLSLLEEAKVRIQVLETELELARGTEESIPLLTEEWSEDIPSTYTRKPD